MPKTKIICTIGPATDTPEGIRKLIKNGMSVARLNFSHGTHAEHKEKILMIRSISKELDRPVAILLDLCGPKIRVGEIPSPGIHLVSGQTFVLTGRDVESTGDMVTVSYKDLSRDVKPGDRILLADGLMELVVEKDNDLDVVCRVTTGGVLTSHKGVNLPTRSLNVVSFTEKDQADLMFGLDQGADLVALSFVRTAGEIERVKDLIREKGSVAPVIAKIEKHEAIANIESIMAAADAIMVARGDLGVEIPPENVPGIQRKLVKQANAIGKPIIIATQMLRSMVDSPRPTRAEAADVANAVYQGADAVMLSEETAVGSFPDLAVAFMARIAASTEKDFQYEKYLNLFPQKDVSASVAYAACVLADHLDAAAVIATTRSGATARNIARFRPKPNIIALSPEPTTVKQLSMVWGCIPYQVKETPGAEEKVEKAAAAALEAGLVKTGDLVVITAGHPEFKAGTTNMIQVKVL
jgi:pyruvate kinase